MATTSPDKIYSPDAGQPYALTQDLLAMADSVQDALNGGTIPGDTSLPASGSRVGQRLMALDSGVTYLWSGFRWIIVDSGMKNLTIFGGWSNVSGTPAASYQVTMGMCYLHGRLNAGSGATTRAFILPSRVRPAQQIVSQVVRGGNFTETVLIGADGAVDFFDLSLPASDYRLSSIPPFPVG